MLASRSDTGSEDAFFGEILVVFSFGVILVVFSSFDSLTDFDFVSGIVF